MPYHSTGAFGFELCLAAITTALFVLISTFMLPALVLAIVGEPLYRGWENVLLGMYAAAGVGLCGFWDLALAYRFDGRVGLLRQPARAWAMAHVGAATTAVGLCAWLGANPTIDEAFGAFLRDASLFAAGTLVLVPYATLLTERRRDIHDPE